jgi:hypothetical protein
VSKEESKKTTRRMVSSESLTVQELSDTRGRTRILISGVRAFLDGVISKYELKDLMEETEKFLALVVLIVPAFLIR